ncbi:MAG: hypothetical protein K8R16_01085 [Anaerolineales bacterium]|nr:hypothetical protein [Anaerolineales bacterium]
MKPILFIFLIVIILPSCATLSETTIIETLIPTPTIPLNASSTESFSPLPTSSSTPIPASASPLPTQLTIVPPLNPTQVIQQEEINSVLQEYFEIHYQALSVSPPANFLETGFGDLVSDGPDAKDFLEAEMAKLAVEMKHHELHRLRYIDYDYSLDYLDIVVEEDGQIAKVHLIEKFVIFCELSLLDDSENPKICTEGDLTHAFLLRNEQGGWKIVSDAYWDYWWMRFRAPGATTEEVLNAIHLVMQRLETMPSPTP